jgi:DNA uptake protein ComE-like DNA-binding protein
MLVLRLFYECPPALPTIPGIAGHLIITAFCLIFSRLFFFFAHLSIPMKNRWWQSYLTFSTLERRGITALLVLIILIILVRLNIHRLVSNDREDNEKAKELLAAWNRYKAEHLAVASDIYTESGNITSGTLFPFDPNTLDSTGFITLGLKPKTTHFLLNWRRKGKIFYKKEDLKPLYTLKPEEYTRLEPYIAINTPRTSPHRYTHSSMPPLPRTIDLNATDSATLVRLNGIGPTLAHKILEKRNALGGYLKLEQLKEIYTFPDTTFALLREKLVINPGLVRKLSLNSAGLDDLKTHPYIGEKMAKNILLYREGLKQFTSLDQLRQVPLMNEENYRKIAPYFTVD